MLCRFHQGSLLRASRNKRSLHNQILRFSLILFMISWHRIPMMFTFNRIVAVFLCSVSLLLFVGHSQSLAQAVPQQLLPLEELTVQTGAGSFRFEIEIADTPLERQIGLMNRKSMPLNHGMLFDFQRTRVIEMWMKNTFIPLDMVFVKADGIVTHIERNTTPHSLQIISSQQPASHVLELNAGIANQIGLKPGHKLNHPLFTKSE